MVTLGPGGSEPRIHLGRDAVTLDELAARLESLRAGGAPTDSIVLLQTDVGTPVGIERLVTEMVLGKGFRLALVGSNQSGPAAAPLAKPE